MPWLSTYLPSLSKETQLSLDSLSSDPNKTIEEYKTDTLEDLDDVSLDDLGPAPSDDAGPTRTESAGAPEP